MCFAEKKKKSKKQLSPPNPFSFCPPVLLQRKSFPFSNLAVKLLAGREGQA